MARDHKLAKALAYEILKHEGPNRSGFARLLTMHTRAMTGPILFDVCPIVEVERLVTEAADAARKSMPTEEDILYG